VVQGLDALVAEGWLTRFERWQELGALPAAERSLDEAGRCAAAIVERWFADRLPGGKAQPTGRGTVEVESQALSENEPRT
jgi:hypothetical protein